MVNRAIRVGTDFAEFAFLCAFRDDGELGRLLMEMVILHVARTQSDGGKVLKEAADYYKVDTDAIALKVKQEFTAKAKALAAKKVNPKAQPKPAKKTTAA